MKKEFTISFAILLLLTLITIIVFKSSIIPSLKSLLIMSLAFSKIYVVSFYFMELKKAHLFWKISLLSIVGLTIAVIII